MWTLNEWNGGKVRIALCFIAVLALLVVPVMADCTTSREEKALTTGSPEWPYFEVTFDGYNQGSRHGIDTSSIPISFYLVKYPDEDLSSAIKIGSVYPSSKAALLWKFDVCADYLPNGKDFAKCDYSGNNGFIVTDYRYLAAYPDLAAGDKVIESYDSSVYRDNVTKLKDFRLLYTLNDPVLCHSVDFGNYEKDNPIGKIRPIFTIEREDCSAIPKAIFKANQIKAPVNSPIYFADMSMSGDATRVWDFGDGTTSTEENPYHTYTKPGKYTVSLTINRNCPKSPMSDTAVQKDYITVTSENPQVPGSEEGIKVDYKSGLPHENRDLILRPTAELFASPVLDKQKSDTKLMFFIGSRNAINKYKYLSFILRPTGSFWNHLAVDSTSYHPGTGIAVGPNKETVKIFCDNTVIPTAAVSKTNLGSCKELKFEIFSTDQKQTVRSSLDFPADWFFYSSYELDLSTIGKNDPPLSGQYFGFETPKPEDFTFIKGDGTKESSAALASNSAPYIKPTDAAIFLGDCDRNWKYDYADLSAANSMKGDPSKYDVLCDFDGDRKITDNDVSLLIKKLGGTSSTPAPTPAPGPNNETTGNESALTFTANQPFPDSPPPAFIPDWLWSAVRPVTAPVMTFFSGSPAVEPQTRFEPVMNPATGTAGSPLAQVNPVSGNNVQGSEPAMVHFGPSAAGNTGDVGESLSDDRPKVFLPDNIVITTTTPAPYQEPQVFVPIVTIVQETWAAPVVEVVTPQGGYQLRPGLRPNCTAPQVACSGTCVDTTGDTGNCGACGNVCSDGYTCSGGMCVKVMTRDARAIR